MEILWWQERGGVLVVMVVEAKPTGEEAGQIEREREREAYRTLWVAEGEEAAVPDRELVKKNEWA
jgi:hypothetical protein